MTARECPVAQRLCIIGFAIGQTLCANRPMPRKFLKKYLPDPAHLREHKHLKVFGARLADPNLWHLNRRSIAGGAFIGLFCALLPMPLQMLPAAMLAILFRANMPLSIALVWLTNPLTMVPVAYVTYHLGAFLIGADTNWSVKDISWDWMWANYLPLLIGSLVAGTLLGTSGWFGVHYVWRLHIKHLWRIRQEKRRAQRDDQSGAR